MKIFNTIRELWKYCSYCAICNANCRIIYLDLDSDYDSNYYFDNVISDYKNENITGVGDLYKNQNLIKDFSFKIDDLKNSMNFSNLKHEEIKKLKPNIYIQGSCSCGKSGAISVDIVVDVDTLKISSPIALESEYLVMEIETGIEINIDQDYSQNKTYINKNKIMDDGSSKPIGSQFAYNLLDINLTDTAKAGKRIQTILTFN